MAGQDQSASDAQAGPAPRRPRRLLLLAPLLFFAGGAGGFFGFRSVRSTLAGTAPSDSAGSAAGNTAGIAFVPLDAMVINLGGAGPARFLRFQAQVEVPVAYKAEVAGLAPRIVDVLNGYLRAVDLAVLEERSALIRLKSQMLRRIQLVAGPGRVRDLLVMEFVVS